MTGAGRRSDRTPLRIKLIAAMLALVAVALAVIGVGSVSMLNGYLVDRVDTQIDTVAQDVDRQLKRRPLEYIRLRPPPDGYVAVYDLDGVLITTQAGMSVENAPEPRSPSHDIESPQTVPAKSGDGMWRVRVVREEDAGSALVAVDLASVRQITTRLALIELLGSGLVMAVLAVVGVVTVRRSLRPLAEIERTAEAIADGDLSSRVPDRHPRTEVGRLSRSLNGMLSQIEAAFQAKASSEAAARESEERMRRFVADASHELRTPLTSIRGFAEFHRRVPGNDAGRLMRRIEDEAARMGLLVDDLLLLARLDQQRPLQEHPVDLLAIAADAVYDARILAPDRDVSLLVESDIALIVEGDEVRLRQVVGNLMTNAMTHTPPGTPVTVRVGTAGERAVVEIADKGPGMTAEQAERVFERFYRADLSRARKDDAAMRAAGGSGLGLSIVSAIVRAHGGGVTVETAPGAGAAFRVVLPLTPEVLTPEDAREEEPDPAEEISPASQATRTE
ncbi:HAMP domain-containing sensor histidine kinase [Microtetraspora sp. NBRC 16547]|uniref:sensor histidine kinase n=1 Tax=Microtetraspora sp. NBRC 16547 TaxID=3030993 RepID=UPI0024A22D4D|nr:HAMP domain-containing sensor histidine kinase [Microtetraspora sp. NBRC 16547]GLW97476.1 two-component sensor histidine kinase [Microtetraspora sp. NBRC 16547]